jgi:enoyl-[acyl-carrier protein] reductase II
MIRSLANSFTDEMERMERDGTPVETRKEYFSATTLKDVALGGDPDLGKLEAGQSCGLIDELLPAGQLVERIAAEATEVLDRLAGLRGR